MQPNEGFGESALRTFFKVFAGMMGLVFSGFVGLIMLGVVASLIAGDEVAIVDQFEYEYIRGDENYPVKIVSIPIEGVILGEPLAGDVFQYFSSLGVTYGYQVKQELLELVEDETVDGVMLEIHSPGGTIFGTQAIVDGVEYYKEQTGKPVYSYIGSVAASGGYWAAIAGDQVIADYGVTIGSIGVISGPFKYYQSVISEDGGAFLGGVVTEGGIETTYVTAGTNKDFGNPYREMTEAEMEIMQQAVNDSYQQFVAFVSEKRNISSELIVNQLGAMVYDEQQAEAANLIDEIGNKHQAFARLVDSVSPGSEYAVIRSTIPMGLFESVLFSTQSLIAGQQRTTELNTVCLGATTILAYHGDPTALCR